MKRGGFLVQLGARDGQGHPPNKEPQMKPGLKVLTCVAREQGSQGWTENKDSPERLITVGGVSRPHGLNTEDTSWSYYSLTKNPGVGVEVGWGRELLTS